MVNYSVPEVKNTTCQITQRAEPSYLFVIGQNSHQSVQSFKDVLRLDQLERRSKLCCFNVSLWGDWRRSGSHSWDSALIEESSVKTSSIALPFSNVVVLSVVKGKAHPTLLSQRMLIKLPNVKKSLNTNLRVVDRQRFQHHFVVRVPWIFVHLVAACWRHGCCFPGLSKWRSK